ncbi:MAG TPA: hypothetical protein VIV06_04555, partial [Candidatus Limnocylindrales bacterium]
MAKPIMPKVRSAPPRRSGMLDPVSQLASVTTSPGPPCWIIAEDQLDPDRLRSAETLFTIGNGRLSTRGSFEEGYPGNTPATLIHGLFDAHPLVTTELANAPDWTNIELKLAGERFSLTSGRVIEYRRTLDLRTGLLARRILWLSPAGRRAELCFERFASIAARDVLCQRLTVRPLDWTGPVEARSSFDATVDTGGFRHWRALDQDASDAGECGLLVETTSRAYRLALAARLRSFGAAADFSGLDLHGRPVVVARWHAEEGAMSGLEKTVTFATSRETPDPRAAARLRLAAVAASDFGSLFAAHALAWKR